MSTVGPPSAMAESSAEAQAAAFASDPRVYFSTETKTWRFENDDGDEMEYDTTKGVWVPVLEEDLVKVQQAAYSVPGVDEETPAAPLLAREHKKRKGKVDNASYDNSLSGGLPNKRSRGTDKSSMATNAPPSERKPKNTAVYVTGLPEDAEVDEIVQRFSKFGVIEEGDDGDPKVKMYAREDGTFSGEALVVYFKEESVALAIDILDDAELRLGDAGTVMRVQKATFEHKSSGSGDKPRKTVDKKRATKRIGKMQKKLLEWDDEDGFGPSIIPEDSVHSNKNSRIVVLKYMFTLKELAENVPLLLDLKKDVREECATLGDVTNVTLYDKEPEGIMTVKFRDPISAQACVIKMNGRYFAGRQIEATLYTGRQRFNKSGTEEYNLEGGGDEDEKRRLDDFAKWLMTEGE